MERLQSTDLYLIVGSYAEANTPGISLYQLNSETGESHLLNTFSGILNPSYLALSRDGRFLYTVSETATPAAQLVAYAFDKAQRRLTLINAQPTGAAIPALCGWIANADWRSPPIIRAVTSAFSPSPLMALCNRPGSRISREGHRVPPDRRSPTCIASMPHRMSNSCMGTI